MSEFERSIPLERMSPELQYVESINGQPSLAWQLTQPGQRIPQELTHALARKADKGQTVVVDVAYRDGERQAGIYAGFTGVSGREISLQFASYVPTQQGREITQYVDSGMLGLKRMQQGEVSARFINWFSFMRVGSPTSIPNTHTDFNSTLEGVIVESARIATAVPSIYPTAQANQEFGFEAMRAQMVNYAMAMARAESAQYDPSVVAQAAKRSFRWLPTRKKN